jgi:hypothetical protein
MKHLNLQRNKQTKFTWTNANEIRVSNITTCATISARISLTQLSSYLAVSSIEVALAHTGVFGGCFGHTCGTIQTLVLHAAVQARHYLAINSGSSSLNQAHLI